MKINEINSEQWEVKESGFSTIIVGVCIGIGGGALLGWAATHLASIAWWWMLVGGGALILGGIIIMTASSRQMKLRRHGSSDIVTTRLVGGKQTRLSFDVSQIVSVNLDTSDELRTSSSGGDQTTTRERVSALYVLLRDNSEITIATSRSGSNGMAINGLALNSLIKAPLADEAQRLAAFYNVPLSSRAHNAGGIETIASVVGAVQQGIAGAQQPVGVMNVSSPQPQTVAEVTSSQAVVPIVTPIQSATPVVPPAQSGAVQAQVLMSQPTDIDEPTSR